MTDKTRDKNVVQARKGGKLFRTFSVTSFSGADEEHDEDTRSI
jgi:hypothetical protein